MGRNMEKWTALAWGTVATVALTVAAAALLHLEDPRTKSDKYPKAPLKQIAAAQKRFFEADLDRNGVNDYGSLAALLSSGALLKDPTIKGVYRYEVAADQWWWVGILHCENEGVVIIWDSIGQHSVFSDDNVPLLEDWVAKMARRGQGN
jgi:hypothetical protein